MKQIFGALLLLILINGCASKSANVVTTTPTKRFIITNESLQQKVQILKTTQRYTNNLLEAMVLIFNTTNQPKDIEYRFIWLDSSGFAIDKTPWLPLTINPKEERQIIQIAHTPQAVSFQFSLRPKQ